jgi:hypothetical protein
VQEQAVRTNEDELLEELHRQREEILRLRDLLIARDAELGAARGRAAELEEGSARLMIAYKRLRSFVPGSVWALASSLRRGRRG